MSESRFGGRDPKDLSLKNVLYEKEGGIARITINRPEVLNALNFDTLLSLSRAFQDAAWDDEVAVVVLTGAGERAFSTGADLTEQEYFVHERPHDYWKWMGAFIEAHDRLRNIGKPTIARLNGMVVGGGNEFHIACDLAVAADDIIIRQVVAARGSVAAAGASQWLPLIVGDRRAREILLLCEPIPAGKALEWGLVNRVVPRQELDNAVSDLAGQLLEKLPEATRYLKQQLNFWRDLPWALTVGHARDWLSVHTASRETQMGIDAFVEKRPIDYRAVRSAVTAEIMHCAACGADCRHGDRYCSTCGHRLKEEA